MDTLTIQGKPKAKDRPRAKVQNGRAWVYTPKATAEYERHVALSAMEAGWKPIEGDLGLFLNFQISGQGDWDNLSKSVCDGLNGVAYHDDKQVRFAIVLLDKVPKDEQCAKVARWNLEDQTALLDGIRKLLAEAGLL